MAGSLSGAATSLKTLFLVKQDKGKCITFSKGTNGQRPFLGKILSVYYTCITLNKIIMKSFF